MQYRLLFLSILSSHGLLASSVAAQRMREIGSRSAQLRPVHELLPASGTQELDVIALGAGDLDQDGDLDALLGVAWFDEWGDWPAPSLLYLNDGGRLHDRSVRLPAAQPYEMAGDIGVTDLDGDGAADLLIPQRHLYGVDPGPDHLYLNDGDARFTDASDRLPAIVGDGRAVRFADLEGDGDQDVLYPRVVPDGGGPALTPVLHRNDGASFTDASSALPPGPSFTDGRFGDMDGDGDADVVLSKYQRTALWKNDGLGGLSDVTATHVPAGRGSALIALADVDGDGDLDVCARALLLRNAGDGTLIDANLPGTSDSRPLSAVDVEADGDVDLFGPDRVLRNDGSGNFTLDGSVPHEVETFTGFAAGDWDGDGDVDALVTEEGGYFGPQPRRADYLLLNDGSGTFRDSRRLAAAFPDSLWYTACLGRLDADPFPDLIALDYESDTLEARMGDWTGGFGPPVTIAPPPSVREYDVAAGDLDGDGDGDVLRGSSIGVHLFRNEGASYQQVSTPVTIDGYEVELADVDGDGDLDFATREQWAHNSLLLNDGAGGFSIAPVTRFPRLPSPPTALLWADVDGDGDPDALYASERVWLFRNDGAGHFADVSATHVPDGLAYDLAAGDTDGDGAPEILVGQGIGGLRVLRNSGAGSFVEWPDRFPPITGDIFDVELVDFDADGACEALVSIDYRGELFANDGAGLFTLADSLHSVLSFVSASDLDLDGDTDVLAVGGEVLLPPLLDHGHQLAWDTLPSIGEELVLELSGPPLRPWQLFFAANRGTTSTPSGTLRLDPWTMTLAAQGRLDGRGHARASFAIPLDAALIGVTSYWQALIGEPQRWSNLEATTFTDL